MIEEVDGSTVVTLHTDERGYTWHVMQREGGSLCLYATRKGEGIHYVHYDTMDGTPPTRAGRILLTQFGEIARLLLALAACAGEEGGTG